MTKSGNVSCNRRRKLLANEKERTAFIAKHGKESPKKKRGRKKSIFNFQKKSTRQEATPPPPRSTQGAKQQSALGSTDNEWDYIYDVAHAHWARCALANDVEGARAP